MESTWEQWLSAELLNDETQLFTKSLQLPLSDASNPLSSSSSSLPSPASRPATSSFGRSSSIGTPSLPSKKIAKPPTARRSRARKGSATTCLTVDAADFREIVQKMTGPIRPELVRPEPRRAVVSASVGPPAAAEVFEESWSGFNVDEFLNIHFPTLESFTGLEN